jgi:hypothetical protein
MKLRPVNRAPSGSRGMVTSAVHAWKSTNIAATRSRVAFVFGNARYCRLPIETFE